MTVTKETLRIEKLCVAIKGIMLDFPVLSRSDLRSSFPQHTSEDYDAAIRSLVEQGFITLAKGPRGGERYVRNPQSQG
jgi:hypothetical protein